MFQDYIQEEYAVQSHGKSHCSYLLPFSKTLLTHCQPVVEIVGCSWLRSIILPLLLMKWFLTIVFHVLNTIPALAFNAAAENSLFPHYRSDTCFALYLW